MQGYFEPLEKLPAYRQLLKDIENNHTPVLTTGVVDVQKTHFMCALLAQQNRPGLCITHSQRRAVELAADARFFLGDAMVFPARDFLAYRAAAHSLQDDAGRILALDQLTRGYRGLVVLAAEAMFDRLPMPAVFRKHCLRFAVGDRVDWNELAGRLVAMGYERGEKAEALGQFALRGGILDVFSPGSEQLLRLELWGDEIDSLRLVDPLSQRSMERLEECRILPVRELCYDPQDVPVMATKMAASVEKQSQKLEDSSALKQMLEDLTQNGTLREGSLLAPYLPAGTASLLEYLPRDAVIFYDDPSAIRVHAEQVEAMFAESMKNRLQDGQVLPEQTRFLYTYEELLGQALPFPQVLFSAFAQSAEGFRLRDLTSVAAGGVPGFRQQMDLFGEELAYRKKDGWRTLILGGTEMRCRRLLQELTERGIEAAYVPDAAGITLEKGEAVLAPGSISKGFQYSDIKLGVFSDHELFGERASLRRPKKRKKGTAIQSFTDLKTGDYVVHDNHGIGVFCGLETITSQGISKEYMKISYAAGGNLFIPVSQLDMLQKYIGGEGAAPKLNKLGGDAWNKSKARARAAVAILAKDLVAVYAKRQQAKGFVYSPDTVWQKEFEETFPYEETDDQLAAVEDVKRDMEAGRVMDRLICGDVGYGKTEVALRAAFKAVQDGKQVAVLAPTTILAQQHTRTFSERMEDFPVTVRQLSRFVGAKEQKETLRGLKNGLVDIVIGTHRLLSQDVSFKNLGLLIVDEEQRFGVAHKEKLKVLKENVDVLTLTATPIPRTLHMSLSGIRDMSLLEEPPQARRPVQTYVLENNQEFIREAIYRELDRDGQVFYLHNRVGNIAEEAARVQALCPDARVGYAHGRMSERELETVMKDFIDGNLDVLVCTTIIENGLDIPNVNTLIVQDADRLGLSQLYQLRGRVGRSSRTAFAYLFYRYNKVLTQEASARLSTIREFTAFGSGFKIAMRDLEIRGAGNFLGAEQHGHMEAVGYDLYCRLLDEEVRRLKGEKVAEDFETSIDLNVNAYLPDFYIPDQEERLEMYQKVACIREAADYLDVQDELLDRYGDMPKAVGMLLEISLLKARAHQLGILSVAQKDGVLLLTFQADAQVDPAALTGLLNRAKGRYSFTAGASPYLTVHLSNGGDAFEEAKAVVDALEPQKTS